MLARELDADLFVMATDVDAVFTDWGTPEAKAIHTANPRRAGAQVSRRLDGAKGRSGLPLRRAPGKKAAIGALADIAAIVRGEKGTILSKDFEGLTWHV